MPTKHLRLDQTLLAAAAALLVTLQAPLTISAAWERTRDSEAVTTFDRFALALDLLFALGLVSLESGRLQRTAP